MSERPSMTETPGSVGSLLRLFKSEYFNANLHMHYLLRMEQSGVQDYLVNELYKMADDDIDYYLPQLCQLALLRYKTSSLYRFLLDKATRSIHFALKILWIVQSVAEDRTPELFENALAMVNGCETAIVNSESGVASVRPPRIVSNAKSEPSLPSPSGKRQRPPPLAEELEGEPAASEPEEKKELQTPKVLERCKSCPAIHFCESPGPDDEFWGLDDEQPAGMIRHISWAHQVPDSPSGHTPGAWMAALRLDPDQSGRPPGTPAGARTPGGGSCLKHIASAPRLAGAANSFSPPSRRVVCHDPLEENPAPSASDVLKALARLSESCTAEEKAAAMGVHATSSMPNAYLELGEATRSSASGIDEELRQFMHKQCQCDYFNTQNHFVSLIMMLGSALVGSCAKAERLPCLQSTLRLTNRWLLDRQTLMAVGKEEPLCVLGLHLPIASERDNRHQILRLCVDQCRVFSTATRAPFLLVYEAANLDEEPAEEGEGEGEVSPPQPAAETLASCLLRVLDNGAKGLDKEATAAATPPGEGESSEPCVVKLRRRVAAWSPEEWRDLTVKLAARPSTLAGGGSSSPSSEPPMTDPAAAAKERSGQRPESGPLAKLAETAAKARKAIWGEPWALRRERIRQASPFGHYRSWQLHTVFVKNDDDLRQELLASQIIKQFSDIFRDANLPLWLLCPEVLVTSSSSGFTSFIEDSNSIDSIKKDFTGKSLAEIFLSTFADGLFEAKRNFIESYAAYSLVVWFLQVKDRHNGNLMMLNDGHVVHIDFGFMLSNSPGGNMAFEQSPFMLTQEFLDIMGGEYSDEYEYFRTLVIRGFLEARKQMERITLPVRMMLQGSKMPCFREGSDAVLTALQDRFFVNLTEEACIEKVIELIDTSVNNWRTITYHNIQRLTNGIL